MRRIRWRPAVAATFAIATLGSCSPAPPPSLTASSAGVPLPSPPTSATPPPAPGHEVYGFVPYWEVDDGIAAHLRATRLTTLALYSVTNTAKGAINDRLPGYRAITGPIGETVIREAHERGVRIELVFTSFGLDRNRSFFADQARQAATIGSLVAMVGELGLDGLNVDVEGLDPLLVPAYGAFVAELRTALVAADGADRLSVATTANVTGAAMAVAAVAAGADRVFMMGYDYRVSTSSPGATSPLGRRDGSERDLPWSLDLYAAAGVPVERTLLGLPLYGVAWPVAAPAIGAPETGPGDVWIPRRNLALLADPSIVPLRDETESVEVYLVGSDGSTGPPTPAPASGGPMASPSAPGPAGSPAPPASTVTWRAIYVDSPSTLAPKLALANDRGLAGAGFWAIGYERGLPGYTDLIGRFAAGDPVP